MTLDWHLISKVVAFGCFAVAAATLIIKPQQWTFWLATTATIQVADQLAPHRDFVEWLAASEMSCYTLVLSALALKSSANLKSSAKRSDLSVPAGWATMAAFLTTVFLKATPLFNEQTTPFFANLDVVVCVLSGIIFATAFGHAAWKTSRMLAIVGALAAVSWGTTTLFDKVEVGTLAYDLTGIGYDGGALITFLAAAVYAMFFHRQPGVHDRGGVNTGGTHAPA